MNWYYTVDISAIYKGYRAGEIEAADVGKAVAAVLGSNLLSEIGIGRRRDVKSFIAAFEKCQTIEDYDNTLEALYDWGDTRMVQGKLCWIKTL